ncbi:MAG: NADH:flavin oxidoreductase, partial [candidate division Zixibacteria bacterium]|nr:NADH:flavin oxidoreductase [candidate division Zixibacteria bacterium]
MSEDILFNPLPLRRITLKNRIIRSATYEGLGDESGIPCQELADLYCRLALGGVGALITGVVFISWEGRAMQPRQCGIDSDNKIEAWRRIIDRVRKAETGVKLFMQLAHTGRQTRREVTGRAVLGVSSKACTYFRQTVRVLRDEDISKIIREFARGASRA